MSKFNDWVDDVGICETVGSGWCVRIDGSDVFESPRLARHGTKARRTLSISSGHSTEEDARAAAIEWLSAQIENISQ